MRPHNAYEQCKKIIGDNMIELTKRRVAAMLSVKSSQSVQSLVLQKVDKRQISIAWQRNGESEHMEHTVYKNIAKVVRPVGIFTLMCWYKYIDGYI